MSALPYLPRWLAVLALAGCSAGPEIAGPADPARWPPSSSAPAKVADTMRFSGDIQAEEGSRGGLPHRRQADRAAGQRG